MAFTLFHDFEKICCIVLQSRQEILIFVWTKVSEWRVFVHFQMWFKDISFIFIFQIFNVNIFIILYSLSFSDLLNCTFRAWKKKKQFKNTFKYISHFSNLLITFHSPLFPEGLLIFFNYTRQSCFMPWLMDNSSIWNVGDLFLLILTLGGLFSCEVLGFICFVLFFGFGLNSPLPSSPPCLLIFLNNYL